MALKVKDQIVATGKVTHARLGVSVQDVNQALAESFGMPAPAGALVSSITRGSASAAAGLQPGDVILEVAGRPIESAGGLSSAIGLSTPGERVKLKVWRERAALELDVRLGCAGDAEQQAGNGDPAIGGGRLGLALRPLTPQERSSTGVEQGLVVEAASGPAARAGIRAGDVVLAIDGMPLQSAEPRNLMQAKRLSRCWCSAAARRSSCRCGRALRELSAPPLSPVNELEAGQHCPEPPAAIVLSAALLATTPARSDDP
jgi:serine protease Do